MIQPIETIYKGYRFRSRLEARWAVFFDALGVEYEYEKEGYDLGAAGFYLPDFWLPTLNMWAEVKAEAFSIPETDKAQALADGTEFPVLKLIGPPVFQAYWIIYPKDQGWGTCDVLLDDQYVHDEHRWYTSTGLQDGQDASDHFTQSTRTQLAYEAARSARFEYGEQPRMPWDNQPRWRPT